MKKEIIILSIIFLTVSTATAFLNSPFDRGKAAVISLEGQIIPSSRPGAFSSGGAITPAQVRELNSKAREKNADTIIYEINSGGGSVVASKEIMREIKSVDMPTVCRFRDISASGAYLSALGCDKIVADSASLTGSIGVKSSYLEFSELFEEHGIDYINVSSGRYKEVGSPFKNATEEDRKFLEDKTEQIHRQFVSKVANERDLNSKQEEKIASGKIFLGSKAKDLKLVDRLGGRTVALKTAENLTGKDLKVKPVKSSPGFNFLSLLASTPVKQLLTQETPLKAEWQ